MSIRARTLGMILAELLPSADAELTSSDFGGEIVSALAGREIASDFIICDKINLKKYNRFFHYACPANQSKWTVFAVSGQGDFWLLNSEEDVVAFYDHDLEDFSMANIKPLNVTLKNWMILADIVSQLENKTEHADDRVDFEAAINSLDINSSDLPFLYF